MGVRPKVKSKRHSCRVQQPKMSCEKGNESEDVSWRHYRRVNVGWRNQESVAAPWWRWWGWGGLETENTTRTVLWACRSLDVSPLLSQPSGAELWDWGRAARSGDTGRRFVRLPLDFTWTDVLQTLQPEVSSCLFFHRLVFLTSLGWFCAQGRKKSNDDCWCRNETRWGERREMALCDLFSPHTVSRRKQRFTPDLVIQIKTSSRSQINRKCINFNKSIKQRKNAAQ